MVRGSSHQNLGIHQKQNIWKILKNLSTIRDGVEAIEHTFDQIRFYVQKPVWYLPKRRGQLASSNSASRIARKLAKILQNGLKKMVVEPHGYTLVGSLLKLTADLLTFQF